MRGSSGRYLPLARRDETPKAVVSRLTDRPRCEICKRGRRTNLMARIVGEKVQLANVCHGCELRGGWRWPRFLCLKCGRLLKVGEQRLICDDGGSGCGALYPPRPLLACQWLDFSARRRAG
jgi:hypothetical protein